VGSERRNVEDGGAKDHRSQYPGSGLWAAERALKWGCRCRCPLGRSSIPSVHAEKYYSSYTPGTYGVTPRGAMPPRSQVVRVDALRQAAAARTRSSSLRAVARQIGMSAPGLQAFLDGRSPYAATLRKLTAWYVRENAKVGSDTSTETAAAALEIITRDLPDSDIGRAIADLVEALEQLYDRSSGARPTWLRLLRESVDPGHTQVLGSPPS
jgi:hypothetical protein